MPWGHHPPEIPCHHPKGTGGIAPALLQGKLRHGAVQWSTSPLGWMAGPSPSLVLCPLGSLASHSLQTSTVLPRGVFAAALRRVLYKRSEACCVPGGTDSLGMGVRRALSDPCQPLPGWLRVPRAV